MKRFKTLFLLILTVILTTMIHTACGNSQKAQETGQSQQQVTESDAQEVSPVITGKVVETMNSGGYSYVKLEKDGEEIWVAVQETDIKVGGNMSFRGGTVMRNFTSKTLDRTFDSIVFSSGPAGQHGSSPHSGFQRNRFVKPELENIQVEKAEGDDAYTVGELYEKSADLDTRTVRVKGVVVKVSTAIMGTNWVHIQDGSGDTADGSNDLVVTTDDIPSVGETITVSGTLARDKDFGAGYRYAVIVENATVSK
jgi:hypothetical protein